MAGNSFFSAPLTLPQQNAGPPDDFVLEAGPPDDFVADQTWAPPEGRSFVQRNLTDPLGRGFNRAQQAGRVAGALAGVFDPLDVGRGVVQDELDMRQYPMQPEDQAVLTGIQDQSFLGALGDLLTNPATTGRLAVEQAPNIAGSLVGGAFGAATGSVAGPLGTAAGAAVGAGAASYGQEYAFSILQALQEGGHAQTPEAMEAALQDPAFMETARAHAHARGLPIAVFDTLSAGLVGRIAGPTARILSTAPARAAPGLAARGAGLATETVAQGAFGSLGELAAQINSEGRVTSPAEIAMEGVLEVPGVVAEIPSLFANQNAPLPASTQTAQTAPPVPVPPGPLSQTTPPQGVPAPNAPAQAAHLPSVPPPLPASGPEAAPPLAPAAGLASPAGSPAGPVPGEAVQGGGAPATAAPGAASAQFSAVQPEDGPPRSSLPADTARAAAVTPPLDPPTASVSPIGPPLEGPDAPVSEGQTIGQDLPAVGPRPQDASGAPAPVEQAGGTIDPARVRVMPMISAGTPDAFSLALPGGQRVYVSAPSGEQPTASLRSDMANAQPLSVPSGFAGRLKPGALSQADVNALNLALPSLEAPQAAKARQVTKKNQALMDADAGGASSEGSAKLSQNSDTAPDTAPDTLAASRTSRPSRAPHETAGPSRSRDVWEAMGKDPAASELLPAENQFRLLSSDAKTRFGFQDIRGRGEKGPRANRMEAVGQLKDAHRSLQFMAHVLEIPNQMIGLGGRVSLAFERKNGRYLGSYNPATRSIALPGRTNSFAHEWFHALDHMLLDRLGSVNAQTLTEMWSRAVRGGDLMGRTQSKTPVEQAFVDLLNTLFLDDAKLALEVLRLENSHAQDAQAKLDRLLSGASQSRNMQSRFRQRVRNATGNRASYYTNVAEMLARSFEAYVAHKVHNAGGGNAFITKGDDAYSGKADLDLVEIYPDARERLQVFAAFDELFHQLRNESVFGNAAGAVKPGAEQMISPMHYHKVVAAQGPESLQTQLKNEYIALARAVSNTNQRGVLKNLKQAYLDGAARVGLPARLQGGAIRDTLSGLFFSIRGRLTVLEKRNAAQGGAFIGYIRDKIATRPGEGVTIGVTYEEEAERQTQKYASRIDDAISALKLRSARTGFLSETDNGTLRQLLLGKTSAGASRELTDLAAEIRQIMTDAYSAARQAGVEMGFVADTGYLARMTERAAVDQNPEGFVRKAAEVYERVFDRDMAEAGAPELIKQSARLRMEGGFHFNAGVTQRVRLLRDLLKLQKKGNATQAQVDQATENLRDAMRMPWARMEADDWKQKIIVGNGTDYATRGPDASPTESRKLPPQADDILVDYLVSDPLEATMQYLHSMSQRTAYARLAGKVAGNASIDTVMERAGNQNRKQDPRYDRATPEGQLNILRELTDSTQDDLVEMAFDLAGRAGAPSTDIMEARGLWNTVTGRVGGGDGDPALNRFTSTIYTLGLLTLLPRAAWTAATEPLVVLARTGNTKAAVGSFAAYTGALGQWVRTSQNTRELIAMSKALGLIATPLFDNVLMNRMNADFDQKFSGEKLLSRFFQVNLLTPLTNAQRQAVLRGAHIYMLDLARLVSDAGYSKREGISAERAKADLRELGVADSQMDAFVSWLLTQEANHVPSVDTLADPMGKLWGETASRFVDTTIMNPRRVDKARSAMSNWGRVIFALTSFIYKFTQEIHLAALARTKRNAAISGEPYYKELSPQLVQFAAGFTLLFAGQLVQTVLREAVFSQERWEEKDDEDELAAWLSQLAFSRTGFLGVGDILWNAMTGLRYERDLTSLTAGAGLGYYTSNIQNVINGVVPNLPIVGPLLFAAGVGGRNSPTTLTAERTALKSAYRLIAVPAMSFGMSMFPTAGPVSRAIVTAAMQYGTSATPASTFAETFIPEDD